MNYHLFTAFLLITVVLFLTPGPIVTLIIATAARSGTRAALMTVAGASTGNAVLLALIAFGLGWVLRTSAELFEIMRWAGAAYLIWLGIQAWRNARVAPAIVAPPAHVHARRGFLVAMTNPKTIAFFTAFLPQFVDPALPVAPQLVVMCVCSVTLGAVLDCGWAVVAGYGRSVFIKPQHNRLLGRLSALALIGGGVWLSLARRPGGGEAKHDLASVFGLPCDHRGTDCRARSDRHARDRDRRHARHPGRVANGDRHDTRQRRAARLHRIRPELDPSDVGRGLRGDALCRRGLSDLARHPGLAQRQRADLRAGAVRAHECVARLRRGDDQSEDHRLLHGFPAAVRRSGAAGGPSAFRHVRRLGGDGRAARHGLGRRRRLRPRLFHAAAAAALARPRLRPRADRRRRLVVAGAAAGLARAGFFQDRDHLAVAAALGQRQRRRAGAVGDVAVGAGLRQRVEAGDVALSAVAEHDRLDQRRPAEIVDVGERRAGRDQGPHDLVMAKMRGGKATNITSPYD